MPGTVFTDRDAGVPEWGDPYDYPAGYDGYVSFHPPGSEGWPYPNHSYLRPWPPPGATSSSGAYNAAAWPLSNGYYGDIMPRHRRTAYPLSNQPVYHIDGSSRPGPMMRVAGQHLPCNLIQPSSTDEYGYGYVDLRSEIHYQRGDPSPLIHITHSEIQYLGDFTPRSLSKTTTVPPCKWMRLEHPRYPWKIVVTAQVPAQGCLAGVTLDDIFMAVADDLRRDVTSVEAYSVLGASDALQRQHVASLRDGRPASFSRLKRIHWLGMRSVQFLGITPDKHDPELWHMHFSHDDLPERPLPSIPLEDDSPPEYELSSTVPSFIIIDQGGVYRAVRIEPSLVHPAETALPYHRDRKIHGARTSIPRHRGVS